MEHEPLLFTIVISIAGTVIIALAVVVWSMFQDHKKQMRDMVLMTNDHGSTLKVHHERIETNKAKIDRHERLLSSDYAENQAELIVAKIRAITAK
jgi:hypothetical protein